MGKLHCSRKIGKKVIMKQRVILLEKYKKNPMTEIRGLGRVVKYQEEYGEWRDPEEETVATEGIHVSIQVSEVRIMGKEEGMVHMEKERKGCVGEGELEGEENGYLQII